ncbi:tetratricopeptide repeat protein [Rhodobacteraceae bacterium]|nr:tetratricopeptide repeat protein [Paracoccaceae bacterium]
MRFLAVSTAAMLFALPAFAVEGDDPAPPKPTETTTMCEEGQIFDDKTKTCVDADEQSFNDDDRYKAVRELAYAGEFDRALQVIATADNIKDPRFLNYRGFIHRKTGNISAAMAYYTAALKVDPDYILARSYMGMGLVSMGHRGAAKVQLEAIALRGGADTWAYRALSDALAGKATY